MEPQQYTLEHLLKDLIRQVVKEEINQALSSHLPVLLETQQRAVPEIMDIAEAGNFLGLSKATMYKKTASGEIAHYKTGKKLFFKRSELIEWITKVIGSNHFMKLNRKRQVISSGASADIDASLFYLMVRINQKPRCHQWQRGKTNTKR